jgi:hypothetical protein
MRAGSWQREIDLTSNSRLGKLKMHLRTKLLGQAALDKASPEPLADRRVHDRTAALGPA